jgi:hypothetical protein
MISIGGIFLILFKLLLAFIPLFICAVLVAKYICYRKDKQ